jgi:antitoxin (DNA-binding transcriptional repressor) of toxin-antitoxin stability system
MKAVAVKELKNNLSAYLREVSKGEVVLITDRGRVVAEMRRPSVESAAGTLEAAMERLHAEGLLTPGLPQDAAAYRRTKVRMKTSSQSLLDAERGDR